MDIARITVRIAVFLPIYGLFNDNTIALAVCGALLFMLTSKETWSWFFGAVDPADPAAASPPVMEGGQPSAFEDDRRKSSRDHTSTGRQRQPSSATLPALEASAIPAETDAIYSLVRWTAFLGVLAQGVWTWSLLGEVATAFYAVGLICISFAVALAGAVRTTQLRSKCDSVSDECRAAIVKHFGPLAASVDFYVWDRSDFAARQGWATQACFIPRRFLPAVTQGLSTHDPANHQYVGLIAHELGHLVHSDSWRLRVTLGMAAVLIMATGVVFAAVALTVFNGELFPAWRLLLALLVPSGVVALGVCHGLRSRELFADSAAGAICGGAAVAALLSRMAKREPFTKYSVAFRMTHPPFSLRLGSLHDIKVRHRYTIGHCALYSALQSIAMATFIFAGPALVNIGGPIALVFIVPIGILLMVNPLVGFTMRPSLVGTLSFSQVILRGIQASALIGFFFSVIMYLVTGLSFWEVSLENGTLKWQIGRLLGQMIGGHALCWFLARRASRVQRMESAATTVWVIGGVIALGSWALLSLGACDVTIRLLYIAAQEGAPPLLLLCVGTFVASLLLAVGYCVLKLWDWSLRLHTVSVRTGFTPSSQR